MTETAREGSIIIYSLSFTIPQLPPVELWPNRAKPGPQWTTKAWHGRQSALKLEYGKLVYLYALKAIREQGWITPEQATMAVAFIVPDLRRRDASNLYHAFKSGLDFLVKAGVLLDDGPEHLVSENISIEHQRGREGVRIEVKEVFR